MFACRKNIDKTDIINQNNLKLFPLDSNRATINNIATAVLLHFDTSDILFDMINTVCVIQLYWELFERVTSPTFRKLLCVIVLYLYWELRKRLPSTLQNADA